MRFRLQMQKAARQIATNKGESPASPTKALRKLVFQECRDWSHPGAPRVGWKRGEVFEVVEAAIVGSDWRSEWGDVGYYAAQTWEWLWWLYRLVTPDSVIEQAVEKFEQRGRKNG